MVPRRLRGTVVAMVASAVGVAALCASAGQPALARTQAHTRADAHARTRARARARPTHRYVIPVAPGQLRLALRAYRAYVSGLLTTLDGQLATLLSAEQGGDLAQAQADWLPAHLSWLEIGQDDGAYGAFGELGREIDGTSAGLIGGTGSPRFTGFHRVELDLWTLHDTTAAATDTLRLQQLLARLQALGMLRELPGSASIMSNWVLRCHEILEDADRDTLTGADDYGSGTAMASVSADVSATREMLMLLRPEIHARAPRLLPAIRVRLAALDRAAAATQVNGAWVGLAAVPQALDERVNALTGAALERLAPISELIQVVGGT